VTTQPFSTGSLADRNVGWAAIASGVIGIVAFACLIAYLATQATEFIRTGVMSPLGKLLISSNYIGVMLQALCMVPVVYALHSFVRLRAPRVSTTVLVIGLVALIGVAVIRLLQFFSPAVSDILFMGPMGFVGVWLIVVNGLLGGVLHGALRILGIVAGLGLVILGSSFFFLGGLAVLTDGPFAYTNNVNFHIGIAIGGFPAFILYPIWAILLGRKLLQLRSIGVVAHTSPSAA
jgi:hypothetical protein